ncbi:hypothetical protein BC834DRAFT_853717 [Gloeopeniophorella convolvens]|nr:hypothetical protein BC834DRAFT_853717 [Gloeopeniophorella convolvens]
MGISVWLVPSDDHAALLAQLMARHPPPAPDAPHSFPHFHPHVTLATLPGPAAPDALLALREAVPLGQRALRLRFARVLAGTHYFRSVFVSLAPSDALAALRAAFGAPVPPAFPHLSLYYIADEEAHARARLLQELEREGAVRPTPDGLGVVLDCGVGAGADPDAITALEGCTATQLWIVDCNGPVEGWTVLDRIMLATSEH